jgi:hypothetical protein
MKSPTEVDPKLLEELKALGYTGEPEEEVKKGAGGHK